ncbi:hypothetical protein ABZP36_008270 [Zizania latifolia]
MGKPTEKSAVAVASTMVTTPTKGKGGKKREAGDKIKKRQPQPLSWAKRNNRDWLARTVVQPLAANEEKSWDNIREAKQAFASSAGISNVKWFGVEGDYNVLVMDLLGPSLEDFFQFCNRKLSLKTVLMLADQIQMALCRGYPTEFASYFYYCYSLHFEDFLDYQYLKRLFRDLFIREGLCNLQSINLSFTLVTDIGTKKISTLNSLKSVNIDNRQITDVGLSALTSMYYMLLLW